MLLIAGRFWAESLNHLLEWSPTVAVLDFAVPAVQERNIKIDVVFSRPEFVEELKISLAEQAPVSIIACVDHPVVTACQYCIGVKQKALTLVCEDAGPFFEIAERFSTSLKISLIDGSVKWSGIASGGFEKWFPAGSSIYLPGYSEIPAGLRHRGGDRYETLKDGLLQLRQDAFFWVGEDI